MYLIEFIKLGRDKTQTPAFIKIYYKMHVIVLDLFASLLFVFFKALVQLFHVTATHWFIGN